MGLFILRSIIFKIKQMKGRIFTIKGCTLKVSSITANNSQVQSQRKQQIFKRKMEKLWFFKLLNIFIEVKL